MRILLWCGALVAACNGEVHQDVRPVSVPVDGGAGGEAAPAADAPVDPLAAKPVLMVDGPQGAVPTSIVVDLLHPMVTPEQADRPPGGASLTFDPPVSGTLRWEGPSRLRFEPAAPFTPGGSWTVRLTALPTRDGAHTFADPPTLTLHGPALAAVQARLAVAAPGAPEQTLQVAFSAPVDPASAAGRLTIVLPDGSSAPIGDLRAGPAPHVVQGMVRHPGLATAAALDVAVQGGVTGLDGGTAPAGRLPLALPSVGKGAVSVVDVRLREGAAGFAIEVLCDDTAVPQRTWRWDDLMDDSRELSVRCELDPASLGSVRLEPAAPLTVEPVRSGFRLRGDLPRGAYTLRLEAGLRTIDGGVLTTPWEGSLLVPGRAPTLDVVATGRYLPRDAWTSVPLRHRNTGAVEVTVRHVPRENLLFWLSSDQEPFDDRTSTVVARSRIAVDGAVDAVTTRWLDLSALVPKPAPGVYEITTRFGQAADQVRLAVTDLQLVVKGAPAAAHTGRTWQAWALDIHRHTPAPGVDLQVLRANAQILARCTTGSDGACALEAPADPLDPAGPVAVIATRGDDFTYARFTDVLIPQAESDVAGEPWGVEPAFRASLDADRGVFRPGETAHLIAIVRDADHHAPPSDLPVRLDVQDARGRLLQQVPLRTNAVGMVAHDLALSDDAATGAWELRLIIADQVVTRHKLAVEDFVPERMEVRATAPTPHLLAGAPVPIQVEARYLFGGSAEGSRVELRCRLEPSDEAPAALRDWRFGDRLADDAVVRRLELGVVEGRLDAAGRAELRCPSGEATLPGTSRLVAEVGVFEAGGGRVTRASAAATVHPAPHRIGLKSSARRVEPGDTVDVEGVVVDWEGTRVSTVDGVEVELMHVEEEYGWFWDEEQGYESYREWRRPVLDGLIKVPVRDGRFSFSFNPAERGSGYLVRVKGGGERSELLFDMDRWSWGEEAQTMTPAPPDPATVVVTAPAAADPGQPIEVSFTSAWAGRALITVESDRVLRSEWIEVKPGPVTWSFRLDGWVPTAWVGVLILKDPHAESPDAFLPDRAWGTTSVRVRPQAWTLPVRLTAPAEVRSGQPLKVEVEADGAGPIFVAVAAVDEGILQITRFPTPDPLADLFPRRRLGVDTFETVGWSVRRTRAEGSPGGDAGAPAVQRPPPVEAVALWSGLVQLEGGRATISLPVPAWDGRLRVFAVAASPQQVGAAETAVVVADPLVVQATIPRFLLGGDRAEIPVRVTNRTGAKARVAVSLSAEPVPMGGFVPDGVPFTTVGGDRTEVELAEGASAQVVFRVQASGRAGAARLSITAAAPTFTATRGQAVTVRPAAPIARRVVRAPLSPGTTQLQPLITGWSPGTERTQVWVTTSPWAEALSRLDELVGYPHGCVEQTTSATRPLLVAGELLPGVVAAVGGRADVDARVRAGLDRVLSMQTASGGFGYWPGATDPTFWGSVYATHLLIDARAAGHAVPGEAIDRAVAWIGKQVDAVAAGRSVDGVWPEAEAYAHYLLAVAGQPRRGRAARLLGALDAQLTGVDAGRQAEARYLVHAALYTAGDRRFEARLRALDTSPIGGLRDRGWTFWSDLRRRGMTLTVYQELFAGDDAGGEPAADQLARAVASAPRWSLTTQDLAWAITALGKRSRATPATVRSLSLTDGAAAFEGAPVSPALPDRRFQVLRASERPQLALTADATGGALWAVIQSEGVRPDEPWRPYAEGMTLTRRFLRADGSPADPTALALGDVVYVDLAVRSLVGTVPNVAVVGHLPAGWELENTRLSEAGEVAWAAALPQWTVDHLDARDTQVSFYGTLTSSEAHVVYAVRATSAGTFILPPADGGAMYDPAVRARTTMGLTAVNGGWQASFL